MLDGFLRGSIPNEEVSNAIALHIESCNECLLNLERLNRVPMTAFAELQTPKHPANQDAICEENEQVGLTECFVGQVEQLVRKIGKLQSSSSRDATREEFPSTGEVEQYKILEKLGQGGMGVVLKVFDSKFQRSLAVKLLLDTSSPKARERFLEEAKITGQIQHPGVPTVHDFGTIEDGRPFFVMKYIEGRTLAELLNERESASADLSRFTKIFEQIAQTLGYAHQKGIVHRDLKPSNIMVGAFGEVQVMDWGLARRIRTIVEDPQNGSSHPESSLDGPTVKIQETQELTVSDFQHPDKDLRLLLEKASSFPQSFEFEEERLTQAGTVLGTIGFMAPEQARGETDSIGEPCDVFGLGAILCCILTGKPPFRGEGTHETLSQAQNADLKDAFERLDSCGAEEELVELTKSCLHADPFARPKDATVVASKMASYLSEVQDRQRRVELEFATNSMRQIESKKRRRILQVFGMIFVCAGIAVVGSTIRSWLRNQVLLSDVVAAIDEAEQQRSYGNWGNVRQAIERAEGRLGDEAAEYLRHRLEAVQRDADFVEQFEKIRMKRADGVDGRSFDLAGVDEQAAGIFRAYGVNIDGLQAAKDVLLIRESAIKPHLLSAIDEWLSVRAMMGLPYEELRDIADQADDDHWRIELRAALLSGDLQKAQRLANEPNIVSQPPTVLAWLGRTLGSDRRYANSAAEMLKRAQVKYSGDFWINYELGVLLNWKTSPLNSKDAVGYFRVAVAKRPDSAAAQGVLGAALLAIDDPEGAIVHWNQSMTLNPLDPQNYTNLMAAYTALSNPEGVEATLALARVRLPKHFGPQRESRYELVMEGRLRELPKLWLDQISQTSNPESAEARFGLAELYLYLGDVEAYRRECQLLMSQVDDRQIEGSGSTAPMDPIAAERVARTCLLLEADEQLTAKAAKTAAHSVEVGASHEYVAYFQFCKGLAQYRLGNFEDAVDLLEKSRSILRQPSVSIVLAMAQWKIGKVNQAQALFRDTVAATDWEERRAGDVDEWIKHILRREAESLIFENGFVPVEEVVRPSDGYALQMLPFSYVEIPKFRRDDSDPFTVEMWIQEPEPRGVLLSVEGNAALQIGLLPDRIYPLERAKENEAERFGYVQWLPKLQHLAFVLGEQYHYVYLDGKEVYQGLRVPKENSSPLGTINSSVTMLGSQKYMEKQGYHWSGALWHQVRISRIARYSESFSPPLHFEKDQDTLVLYRFDEGQGDVLNDSSGNGYHGAISGAQWRPVVLP